MLGTWVSQVRGLGCEGAGYEVQQAWEQGRQRGSNHELYVSTQHTNTHTVRLGKRLQSHKTH